MINYQQLLVILSDWMMSDKNLTFIKLAESLRNWTDCNPKAIHNSEKHEKYMRENTLKERESKNRESNPKTRVCIIVRNQDINP